MTRESEQVDWTTLNLEEGTETSLGETVIRCKDTYKEKIKGFSQEVVDLEFEAPMEVRIHRDDLN